MKEGAWINAKTGQFAWVDEHSRFIQRKDDALAIGLPERVYEIIRDMKWDFNGEGREQILATAMKFGFIRMRGHGAYWTFEFTIKSEDALWACLEFLMNFAGPQTQCRFNNLRTGESIELPFDKFKSEMTEDPQKVIRQAKVITDAEYPSKMAFLKQLNSPLLQIK